jgi:cytochrome c556
LNIEGSGAGKPHTDSYARRRGYLLRKTILAFGACAWTIGGLAFADIDLSDFDDDVMRSMDDAIKDLEPVIAAKNPKSATEDAEAIRDGLRWTEQYFVKKGAADDAVQYAQKAELMTEAVLKDLGANDLESASAAARTLSKSCKNCHDAYKPLKK